MSDGPAPPTSAAPHVSTGGLSATANPSSAALPSAGITFLDLPARLLDVTRPLTVGGTVTAALNNNQLLLRTAQGVIQLQVVNPPVQLSTLLNQQLFIRILPGQPPQQGQIFFGTPSLLTPQAPHTTPGAHPPAAGLHATANLLPAASGHIPEAGLESFLNRQDSLKAIVLPGNLAQLLRLNAEGGGGTTPGNVTLNSAQSALLSTLANTPAGSALRVVLIPSGAGAASAEPALPFSIIATVQGGQTLVQSGPLSLLLRLTPAPQPGETIHLLLHPETAAGPAEIVSGQRHSVEALLNTLQQIDPQLAQQIRDLRLPSPGPQLPGALMFLMAALRQGDLRHWLGERAMQTLTGGAGELLERAQELFRGAASGENMTSNQGDWRALSLPWLDSMGMRAVHFYVHKDEEEKNAGQRKDRARFLLEVEFSRLGTLQLDGLIQRAQKKMDLILRTSAPLSPSLRSHLVQGYQESLEGLGFAGQLMFQPHQQGWIHFRPSRVLAEAEITA